jgi:hypothetical protein
MISGGFPKVTSSNVCGNCEVPWNPNLVLSSFIQYDTESQNVGTNTRLLWTIKPGNDLFIVWNRAGSDWF